VNEYDIFVPLNYNDGSAIEVDKFKDLQKRLLDEFDGVTFFHSPMKGYGGWAMSCIKTRS
jgi:hypothetical protein